MPLSGTEQPVRRFFEFEESITLSFVLNRMARAFLFLSHWMSSIVTVVADFTDMKVTAEEDQGCCSIC